MSQLDIHRLFWFLAYAGTEALLASPDLDYIFELVFSNTSALS